MNSFIDDHKSVPLILKELNLLAVEQRERPSLATRTYISTNTDHT